MRSILVVQRILPSYRLPLVRELARSSIHRYTIAFGEPEIESGLCNTSESLSLDTIRLSNRYYPARSPWFYWQSGLLSRIVRGHYDVTVVEFNVRNLASVAATLTAWVLRRRLVLWGIGYGMSGIGLVMWIRRGLARLASAVIFYDEAAAEEFVRNGQPATTVFTANNSVDTTLIEGLRKDTPVQGRFRLLHVGRMVADKKLDLVIEAFAQLKGYRGRGMRLTLVGDGPEEFRLRSLSQSLGIGDVVDFFSPTYDEKLLAEYFNTSILSVCGGRVGLFALHSCSYGVPLVLSRCVLHGPEVNELEEGIHCVTFNAEAADELAEAIEWGCRRDDRWQRMSAQCRSLVDRRFSAKGMAAAFDMAVDSVCAVTRR